MKQFYCYTHATPSGEVFYVGKGTGKRAWNFKDRHDLHKGIVEEHGSENIIIDVLPADSEEDALRMERFMITVLFGRDGLVNCSNGGEGLEKINAELQKECGQLIIVNELLRARVAELETFADCTTKEIEELTRHLDRYRIKQAEAKQ